MAIDFNCVVCDTTSIITCIPALISIGVAVLIAFGVTIYLRYFLKVDEFGDHIQ
jgi:uncharacterized membrane protein